MHRIAVAYSGGRDSTALLHATLAAASGQGVEVIALHVHHGLSPNADAWLAHCEAQCRRWARAGKPVAFAAQRLTDRPARGESVEAWARQARYRALRAMALAHAASIVLLAHHRRDQAETFVLQALRGAGVAGLSGMPRSVDRDGITWQRPWLDKPRAEIDAYVRRHRLKHIDDDSNADARFARNRLRLQVWPALVGAFEQAEASLATAAAWAQQADAVLDEVAALDLAGRCGRGTACRGLARAVAGAAQQCAARVDSAAARCRRVGEPDRAPARRTAGAAQRALAARRPRVDPVPRRAALPRRAGRNCRGWRARARDAAERS